MIDKIRNYITYIKEYKMRTQILIVIVLVNVLILFVGIICMILLPENSGKSMFEIIKYSLKLLVDSGGFMDNTTGTISVVLTVIIVIAGMVCFTGGIVAYMSNAVTNLVDNADKGENKLQLADHIIIINWNSKVPLLVADYLRKEERQYIVILSDKDKADVLSEIDKKLHDVRREEQELNNRGMKSPRVIVRSTKGLTSKDFNDVCLLSASSVLIVSPEEKYNLEASDSLVTQQYMLLVAYLNDFLKADETNDLRNILGIIVEIQLEENVKCINNYPIPFDDEETIFCVGVNCNEILGKIIALSVIKPSLYSAILELLSFQGSEIYVRVPVDEDCDYEDVEEHLIPFYTQLITCENTIPLFDSQDYYRAFLIEDGYNYQFELLGVQEDTLKLFIDTNDKDIEKWKLKKDVSGEFVRPKESLEKNILIIGSNRRLKYIISELVKYCNEGLKVTLAYTNSNQKENIERLVSNSFSNFSISIKNLGFELPESHIYMSIKEYSDVLVLSDPYDEVIVDRIPIMFWNIIVRNKMEGINFFIEVINPENKEIIKSSSIPRHYFISNQYISGMFTQLGSDINLYNTMMELLTLKSTKNIWSYKVIDVFPSDKLEFESKKELILWTYKYSSGQILPIGIIRGGQTYLFTNGVTIVDSDLIPANWNNGSETYREASLKLYENDEIIVIEK